MAIQHTLFISTNRLKKDSSLGGSVDDDLLLPYILMAQDRYILPVLGTDLYNKLISDVNNDTLTGNYLTLLQTYIQPALVQFSYAVILPFLRLRMVNNAVVTMSSEQGGSVSHEDLKPLINSAMDMGEFYRERLIDYIRNNTGLFPEYSTNTGADLNPTTQNYYAGLNLDVAPTSNKIKSFLQGANITIFDC
ncbi:MAG: hypothetical protein CMH18_08170 [Methylophaga sp.]|uniref:DUF6712 family protein n=1 Tax=Methylophaga sp. TaxID=2024840 RepID=UPI000C8DD227|nr:DUF6712 family protein [Methylophaga sp.]MAL49717.1 hypothetical protein [Methylophaga sp.]|tara:strand:+ start:3449 stop:4024 length:576 start_codon:yes stop_codon:yes gene_type:complete